MKVLRETGGRTSTGAVRKIRQEQPSTSKTVQLDTTDTDALTKTQSEVASLLSDIYNREQIDKASSCLYNLI